MITRTFLLVVWLGCFAAVVQGQDVAPGRAPATPPLLAPHRTGQFDAALPLRSPESDPVRWKERFQFGPSLERWNYDLAQESYSLYVPDDYDPEGEPYGVIVWISPFDDGSVPPELREVLDAHRMIWIGPYNAGNSRHLFQRAGLAIDAAENVRSHYHVDPERIFVSGLSGGGRMAAMLAIDYPEIFAGGYPIIGVTTYLSIPLESAPGLLVPTFPPPSEDLLDRAKHQPMVILTGSGDFNREECRLTYEAYVREGFAGVHYLEIDGMAHEMPSAEAFGRGINLLLGTPR